MLKYFLSIAYIFIGISVLSQTAGVRGRILDDLNNTPLPFVNVVVSGTTIGTTSNMDGIFEIKGLEPGFITLTVSFLGYETKVSRDIKVLNGKIATIAITLRESDVELSEITVKASPFKKTDESPLSLKSIGITEIETNPGSNRDISRVIQSFPGVATISSNRNDVIIRGGGPSENSYYLDGIEIPTINHFATQGASGGPLGIINADFVGGVKLYSGAFPANTADALSGVIMLTQIDGNSDKLKTRVTLGASEVSGTIDGPLGENSSYILSVRRSYLRFLFSTLGLPFLPTFTDYQFKFKSRLNPKNEITIVSIGALDKFELNTGIENPDAFQEYVLTNVAVNEQWSYAIGGVYKHFGKKGYHTVVLSRNMLNNNSYKYPDNDETKEKTLDYMSQEIENKLRYEYTTRIQGYKLNIGLNTEYAKYTNSTNQQLYTNGTLYTVDYDAAIDLLKYGGFAQISKKYFNERLIASFGIRMDANTFSASLANPLDQIAPRLSLSYALTGELAINFNTGRYSQSPSYTMMGYKNLDGEYVNRENNITYITSNHIIGGFEYIPARNVIFTLEGFYKNYENYPISVLDSISLATKGADYGTWGDEEVVSDGTGRAYGIELMNRIHTDKGLTSIISYTYSHSLFDSYDNKAIPTSWDSRHLLTISLSKSFNKKWQLGGKWRFVSGLPYTPYDMEASANVAGFNAKGGPVLDVDNINTKRKSAFHQLDIRVDRRFNFKKWALAFYVDIQNVYNFKQQGELVIREKDADGNYLTTNNDSEYVLKSINSNAGTVLPTLGIMLEF